MDNYLLFIIANILIGALDIVMGIPLLLEKVKPNWFYGFRLPVTLSSKEIWYKSNRYVGRDFIAAGIIIITVSLVLLLFESNFTVLEVVWIELTLVLASIIIILARGFIYLKRISH